MKTPQVRYRGPNRNMRRNEQLTLQPTEVIPAGPSTEQNVAVIEEVDPGDIRMAPMHQKHLIMTIKPPITSRNPPPPPSGEPWQTHGYD